MKNIIENSLNIAISYQTYRKLVSELLKNGKSTGNNQSDDLLQYSKLSNSRMKRLDKTIQVPHKYLEVLQSLEQKYTWLVITEGWCGDASQVLPVLNKIAETSENIDLKIILRGENDALMQQFLTNGNKAIPKLIAIDFETKEVLFTWGPRPKEIAEMVKTQKEKFGVLDIDFKKKLQLWYNSNKGVAIIDELLGLLAVPNLV